VCVSLVQCKETRKKRKRARSEVEEEKEDGESDFFGRVSRARVTKDCMNKQVTRTEEGGQEDEGEEDRAPMRRKRF